MALPSIFRNKETLHARALFLGQRIDTRTLASVERLALSPLVVRAGEGGCAAVFRYGAVVLFDVLPMEEIDFLESLARFVSTPFAAPASEEIDLTVDPDRDETVATGGTINIHDAAVERLQVVADILAKSAVLSHYETSLAQVFDQIEPLAAGLKSHGRIGRQSRGLLRQVGDVLLTQHTMVGRVEVTEKPEVLWERPEFERLYVRLEDEYELRERHVALERKLELIARIAETILDLLQNKRSLRVEWYIVILIVVEILLTLYAMFVSPTGH
jgi:uncharacterized Rmd1/YagE family protein